MQVLHFYLSINSVKPKKFDKKIKTTYNKKITYKTELVVTI